MSGSRIANPARRRSRDLARLCSERREGSPRIVLARGGVVVSSTADPDPTNRICYWPRPLVDHEHAPAGAIGVRRSPVSRPPPSTPLTRARGGTTVSALTSPDDEHGIRLRNCSSCNACDGYVSPCSDAAVPMTGAVRCAPRTRAAGRRPGSVSGSPRLVQRREPLVPPFTPPRGSRPRPTSHDLTFGEPRDGTACHVSRATERRGEIRAGSTAPDCRARCAFRPLRTCGGRTRYPELGGDRRQRPCSPRAREHVGTWIP